MVGCTEEDEEEGSYTMNANVKFNTNGLIVRDHPRQ